MTIGFYTLKLRRENRFLLGDKWRQNEHLTLGNLALRLANLAEKESCHKFLVRTGTTTTEPRTTHGDLLQTLFNLRDFRIRRVTDELPM